MKKKIAIANWKMNLNLKETKNLTVEILDGLEKIEFKNTEIVFCPSFLALKDVGEIIKKYTKRYKWPIYLGAQDVFWEEKGAYTGEVSPLTLREIGVNFVILGHSERRIYLKEDDEMVHKKTRIALFHHLIPILCVGETLEEREDGRRDLILIKQVSYGLEGIKLGKDDKFIVAYEPVWAIGSGQAVEPKELEHAIFIIKQRLVDLFGLDLVEKNFRLIYGGSVDSSNIKEFIDRKIDGFLIGAASLKAKEFIEIIKLLS
ncbi:MAG: triose-phosphate isomerase [Patescibacteria group bacterium]